jgi:plasmid stabilization system protein ParE
MRRVRWSSRADAEFVDLITYLRDRNRPAALRASAEIKVMTRKLAPHPELGHQGRLVGTRELSFPRWNQVVVYVVSETEIEIVSLRDTRMQIEDNS